MVERNFLGLCKFWSPDATAIWSPMRYGRGTSRFDSFNRRKSIRTRFSRDGGWGFNQVSWAITGINNSRPPLFFFKSRNIFFLPILFDNFLCSGLAYALNTRPFIQIGLIDSTTDPAATRFWGWTDKSPYDFDHWAKSARNVLFLHVVTNKKVIGTRNSYIIFLLE
jgi:hypothetical protein